MFKPSLTALQLCFCVTQAPFIWSKVPEITLSLARQLCETFIWNLTPVNLHSARLHIRKIADERKKFAVNILIITCARTFYSSCLASNQPDKVLT